MALEQIMLGIETTNAAFVDGGECPDAAEFEVGRILLVLAGRLRNGERPHRLRDLNGNTVGGVTYQVSEDTDDE